MAFNRSMGESPEEPSYLQAWLTSPANQTIVGIFAVVAVTLSFPLGLVGALLTGVAFTAVEAIAAMYVPAMGTFRAGVDRKLKAARRAQIVADLSREIERRCDESGTHENWQIYSKMQERIDFLRGMAKNRDVPLTEGDMDRMEDSCTDYLGLWLASLSMSDHEHSVSEHTIDMRIKDLDAKIAQPIGRTESLNLEKAKGELQEMLRRHGRLDARKAAVDTKLLSIPDTLEEIYHVVVAAPTSGSQADRLQEAINRLHVEEDLEASLGIELGETVRPAPVQTPAAAPIPTQASQVKVGSINKVKS
jgi:hypothetical protein